MSKASETKAQRKQLMAYLRYRCAQENIPADSQALSILAGEPMDWRDGLRWLEGQMKLYPPPAYVKPLERGQTKDFAPPPQVSKRKKQTQWQKALRKARQSESSRAGHKAKLAKDAALVARAEMRMRKHRGDPLPKRKRSRQQASWSFYKSAAWRELRARVFEKYHGKCCLCGRSHREDGVKIHADHIKPRSTHPRLELVEDNIQLLCEDCNLGKSNRYSTDWRPSPSRASPAPQESAHTPQVASAGVRRGAASGR